MGLFASLTPRKNIIYKTADEIELIRAANLMVSRTLALVGSMMKPGMSGADIDKAAEEYIRDNGGRPAFKGYHDFPSTLCVSPNKTVVHGIATEKQIFKEGDIVSVDCGVDLEGFYGDAAYTFAIGEISDDVYALCEATYDALYIGIDMARPGKRIGDISYAIHQFCERQNPYGVVRELVGHGVGKNVHEHPDVPNYGRRGQGALIKPGLVIAIEPMVNLGKKDIVQNEDGWTIDAKDGLPSAHYEHSIAVTSEGPDILSNHDYILDSIKNNPNVTPILPKNTIFAPQKI